LRLFVLSIPLTEPTTTLTDYMIAVVAFILAGFLLRVGWVNRQVAVRWWAVAFASVAVAAALGGTCHGFVLQLGGTLTGHLWRLMIAALSGASFAMLVGTILSSAPAKVQHRLLGAAVGKSLLVWLALSQQPRFEIAAIDYLVSMGVILGLQLQALLNGPTRAAPWLIAGILVSGLALGILASGFTLSTALNHNDLYHLVQLIGLGLLYQGAKQLKDR
jgi:hypothetical protein